MSYPSWVGRVLQEGGVHTLNKHRKPTTKKEQRKVKLQTESKGDQIEIKAPTWSMRSSSLILASFSLWVASLPCSLSIGLLGREIEAVAVSQAVIAVAKRDFSFCKRLWIPWVILLQVGRNRLLKFVQNMWVDIDDAFFQPSVRSILYILQCSSTNIVSKFLPLDLISCVWIQNTWLWIWTHHPEYDFKLWNATSKCTHPDVVKLTPCNIEIVDRFWEFLVDLWFPLFDVLKYTL